MLSMVRRRRVYIGMVFVVCAGLGLWAVPAAANTVWEKGTVPSSLVLEEPAELQDLGSHTVLDSLVIQEFGPAVATCTVEVDLVPGMNKVVVSGVPTTVECSGAELLSDSGSFNVVSSSINRASGSLEFSVEAEASSHAVFKVIYPFSGLTWAACYNAVLEPARDSARISAWYSIKNETDCDFAPAKLVLTAGPSNILGGKPGFKGGSSLGKTIATMTFAGEIPSGSERNISFAKASETPARLIYAVDWAADAAIVESSAQGKNERPVMLALEFSASSQSGLACPLPGGSISVFSRSEDGSTFLIGGDVLPPSPDPAALMAKLGPAESLVAVRTRTDQRKVGTSSYEEAYQVRIVNTGATDSTVVNIEEFPGQWTILQSNVPAPTVMSERAYFNVTVPAGGQANILFRVRYTL